MAGRDRLHRNSLRRSEDGGGIGISSLGNTLGTSGTQQLGTYVLQGSNGITLSQLTGNAGQATLVIQGAGAANIALADGVNTISSGTALFSASQIINAGNPVGAGSGFGGGLSFGFNGQTITGRAPGAIAFIGLPGGTILRPVVSNKIIFATAGNIGISSADTDAISFIGQAVAVAAAGSTQTSGTVQFASTLNSNDVAFAFNAGTLTASHGAATFVSFEAPSGSAANKIFSNRLIFGDRGGISFSISGLSTSQTIIAGPNPLSYWHNGSLAAAGVMNDVQQNLPLFQRMIFPNPIVATRLDLAMAVTNSSSAGASLTIRVALYSMSGSTINTLSATSRTFAYNSTLAPSSSYTDVSGTRFRSVALGAWNITPGEYMFGMNFSIATALTSGTHRFLAGRNMTFVANEYPGVLGTSTPYFADGYLTATSSNLASTLVVSDISHTGNDPLAQPWVTFFGTF